MNNLYIRVRGRVLGPYDEEKLQSLARRGQLSRMHELSEDGVNFVRASTYPDLFATGERPVPGTAKTAPPAVNGPAPSSPASPSSAVRPITSASPLAAEWFYGKDGEEIGPVDVSLLQQMLGTGQLDSGVQVWTQGMTQWVLARDVPGLLTHRIPPPTSATASGRGTDGAPVGDSASLSESLRRAALGAHAWALFVAITIFVCAGLSAMFGIFLVVQGARQSLTPVVAAGLFWVILALVLTVGACLLTSYVNRIRGLQHGGSAILLEKALETLRVFWMYVGILLIVLLAFVLFVAVWVVSIGGTFSGFS